MATPKSVPIPLDPLAVGINDAARQSGVGRTLIYRAIGEGELKARKIGRRTVIRVADLAAWIDRLPSMPQRAA